MMGTPLSKMARMASRPGDQGSSLVRWLGMFLVGLVIYWSCCLCPASGLNVMARVGRWHRGRLEAVPFLIISPLNLVPVAIYIWPSRRMKRRASWITAAVLGVVHGLLFVWAVYDA
jgi:hypothetical protein